MLVWSRHILLLSVCSLFVMKSIAQDSLQLVQQQLHFWVNASDNEITYANFSTYFEMAGTTNPDVINEMIQRGEGDLRIPPHFHFFMLDEASRKMSSGISSSQVNWMLGIGGFFEVMRMKHLNFDNFRESLRLHRYYDTVIHEKEVWYTDDKLNVIVPGCPISEAVILDEKDSLITMGYFFEIKERLDFINRPQAEPLNLTDVDSLLTELTDAYAFRISRFQQVIRANPEQICRENQVFLPEEDRVDCEDFMQKHFCMSKDQYSRLSVPLAYAFAECPKMSKSILYFSHSKITPADWVRRTNVLKKGISPMDNRPYKERFTLLEAHIEEGLLIFDIQSTEGILFAQETNDILWMFSPKK